MAYGQSVAVARAWPGQADLPVLRLRRRRVALVRWPIPEVASRLLIGGALGAVLGAATPYLAFWSALGAGVAVGLGKLRDRAASGRKHVLF